MAKIVYSYTQDIYKTVKYGAEEYDNNISIVINDATLQFCTLLQQSTDTVLNVLAIYNRFKADTELYLLYCMYLYIMLRFLSSAVF